MGRAGNQFANAALRILIECQFSALFHWRLVDCLPGQYTHSKLPAAGRVGHPGRLATLSPRIVNELACHVVEAYEGLQQRWGDKRLLLLPIDSSGKSLKALVHGS